MEELWHRPLLEQDFALINPLQVDSDLWADLPTVSITPKALGGSKELMPRLLDLNALSEDRRLQLLERVEVQARRNPRSPYFSALLVSQLPFPQLLQRLSDRLIVRGPDDQIGLLRYYDPRVFQHLLWILTEPQIKHLLLGIECWSWNGGGPKWQQTPPYHGPSASRLFLSESQWGHLQRIGLINRSMRNLGINEVAVTDTDPVARSISNLLQESYQHHGLTQAGDRCRYAEQGIRSIQGQLQQQGMSR